MLSEITTLRSQLTTVIDELEGSGGLEAVLRYARAIRQGELIDQSKGKTDDEEDDDAVIVSVLVNGKLVQGKMGMISPSDNYVKVDLGEQKFTFSEVASRNPVVSEVFQETPTLLNVKQMAMGIHYCCTDKEAIARGGDNLKNMLLRFLEELYNYSGTSYRIKKSYIDIFAQAYPEYSDTIENILQSRSANEIELPNRESLIKSQKSSIPDLYTAPRESNAKINSLIWDSVFSVYDAIMAHWDEEALYDLLYDCADKIEALSEHDSRVSPEAEIIKRLPYAKQLKTLKLLQDIQDRDDYYTDYRTDYQIRPEDNQ